MSRSDSGTETADQDERRRFREAERRTAVLVRLGRRIARAGRVLLVAVALVAGAAGRAGRALPCARAACAPSNRTILDHCIDRIAHVDCQPWLLSTVFSTVFSNKAANEKLASDNAGLARQPESADEQADRNPAHLAGIRRCTYPWGSHRRQPCRGWAAA